MLNRMEMCERWILVLCVWAISTYMNHTSCTGACFFYSDTSLGSQTIKIYVSLMRSFRKCYCWAVTTQLNNLIWWACCCLGLSYFNGRWPHANNPTLSHVGNTGISCGCVGSSCGQHNRGNNGEGFVCSITLCVSVCVCVCVCVCLLVSNSIGNEGRK